MKISLIKKPGAWIPIVLSFIMLIVLGMYLTGVLPPDPTGDEGLGAHLFQIWLVLEALMILFFAVKWFSKSPKQAFLILITQIALVLAVCAPVFYFNW